MLENVCQTKLFVTNDKFKNTHTDFINRTKIRSGKNSKTVFNMH